MSEGSFIEIWSDELTEVEESGIEVVPAPLKNPFDESGILTIVKIIDRSFAIPDAKDRGRWVRGVSVIDGVHLKAADYLGATHFLTTDRCLSEVKCGLHMVLVSDRKEWPIDFVRPTSKCLARGDLNVIEPGAYCVTAP